MFMEVHGKRVLGLAIQKLMEGRSRKIHKDNNNPPHNNNIHFTITTIWWKEEEKRMVQTLGGRLCTEPLMGGTISTSANRALKISEACSQPSQAKSSTH